MPSADSTLIAPKELDELKELGRVATRQALEEYEPIPREREVNLTLGTFFDADDRIFELYIAADKPKDAIVISSTRMNRKSHSVQVVITNLKKRAAL